MQNIKAVVRVFAIHVHASMHVAMAILTSFFFGFKIHLLII
jgi:hypothetical protein